MFNIDKMLRLQISVLVIVILPCYLNSQSTKREADHLFDDFPIFEKCNSSSQCVPEKNLVCANQKCLCQPNYAFHYNNVTDQLECLHFNCDNDYQCSDYDKNRYCSRDGQCKCKMNFHPDETNGQSCKRFKESNCTQNSDCLIDHFLCVSGQCRCAPNHRFDEDNRTCVEFTCSKDYDCHTDWEWGRTCDGGKCVCQDYYYEDESNGRLCTYKAYKPGWKWWLTVITLPIVFGVAIIYGTFKLIQCLRRR